jgi:predicted transcriptional regulator
MKGRELSLIAEISDILDISTTGRKILNLLVRTKKGLSVPEIIARTKRSERSIRTHLKALTELKLIRKDMMITREGRLAYRYFVLRASDLVKSVRKETLGRLRKLEARVRGIRGR